MIIAELEFGAVEPHAFLAEPMMPPGRERLRMAIRRTTPLLRSSEHLYGNMTCATEGRKWLSRIFMADRRWTNESLRCGLPGSSAGRVGDHHG